MFAKNKKLSEIIDTQISEEHYKLIEKWKAIYAGHFKEWHDVKVNTINGPQNKKLNSLGMAKLVCQELAKLIFTEKVEINIDNKTFNDNIKDVLSHSRFQKIFKGKLEQMFALGGLVLKAYPKQLKDGTYELEVRYVTPDSFIPISWENDEVTEGVFLNITRKENKVYCLFESHRWKYIKGEKVLEVKNELYEGEQSTDVVKKVPLSTLYGDLEEVATIANLTYPLFQYLKPNIANNNDMQSPLGISLFANSLDTLHAIDIAFDSFIREFRLGKRRIIVPANAIRTVVDPQNGTMNRYFDANDEVYEAFNFSDPENQKIMDNTVGLRVDEHVAAINTLLDILAMQVGLSAGSFTFKAGTGQIVKTATEVVSENSKTYQTKQVNEVLLEECLVKFIYTLGEVAALYNIFPMPDEKPQIDIYWDDTITKDKYADSGFYIKLNQNGLVSKRYVLKKVLDMTDEQVDEMLEEVASESANSSGEILTMTDIERSLGLHEE